MELSLTGPGRVHVADGGSLVLEVRLVEGLITEPDPVVTGRPFRGPVEGPHKRLTLVGPETLTPDMTFHRTAPLLVDTVTDIRKKEQLEHTKRRPVI